MYYTNIGNSNWFRKWPEICLSACLECVIQTIISVQRVNPCFILEDRCCVCSWKSHFDLKVSVSYIFLLAERSLHYFLSPKGLCCNIPLHFPQQQHGCFIHSGEMVKCTCSGMKHVVLPWYCFLPSCWLFCHFRLSKMDDEDRQKIMQNLVELVEETNLGTLIPKLCERGVFTAEMIQKYMVSYLFNTKVGWKFFLKLNKKWRKIFKW